MSGAVAAPAPVQLDLADYVFETAIRVDGVVTAVMMRHKRSGAHVLVSVQS